MNRVSGCASLLLHNPVLGINNRLSFPSNCSSGWIFAMIIQYLISRRGLLEDFS
jgi:hypothetical protein